MVFYSNAAGNARVMPAKLSMGSLSLLHFRVTLVGHDYLEMYRTTIKKRHVFSGVGTNVT